MPFDVHGHSLALGDEVVIRGRIIMIEPSNLFCNLTVELTHLMPPYRNKIKISTLNSIQVEKVDKWGFLGGCI